jgi:hypothetical protein
MDYEQLRQMVMDMRSQMGGTCAPFFFCSILEMTNLLLLLLLRHYSSLIFICTNKIVMNIWVYIIQVYFYIFQFYTILFF